jgi:hypothetical protein
MMFKQKIKSSESNLRSVLICDFLKNYPVQDKSKAHSWSWALSTVYCSLKTLPMPESSGTRAHTALYFLSR